MCAVFTQCLVFSITWFLDGRTSILVATQSRMMKNYKFKGEQE